MLLDATFNFASGQSLSGTSDQVSSRVYDAGSAKKVFAGISSGIKIPVHVSAVGGTNPTVRARFVAADDAALTTNPIILADTGVSPVLAAGDIPWVKELVPSNQATAKRYYGLMFTQSGTTPTATATAQIAHRSQSNLLR